MSLETLDTHTPSKPVVAVAQVATPADVVAPRSLSAADEHGPLAAEDVDTILYEMTDPLNRYYRYPVAKGMLPLFMRLPFTPNQITAFHACLGLTAGVLIARGTPRACPWSRAGSRPGCGSPCPGLRPSSRRAAPWCSFAPAPVATGR